MQLIWLYQFGGGNSRMLKKVTALKARHNLDSLLEEVYYKGDQYIIERAGKPLAAVVPLWQLQARKERRDQMLAAVQDVWRRTKKVQPGRIEREVEAAVRAVRKRSPRKRA
jgi:prevent-host-death family protein